MNKQLFKIVLFILPLLGITNTLSAQQIYSFDKSLEGWNSKTPAPPAGFSTSISWEKGSGKHKGLAVITPNENPQNPGTTASLHTLIYAPKNHSELNINEYNYLKVTLKNQTNGKVLQVATKPNSMGSKWSFQNLLITTQDTGFKTYTFKLKQELKGENLNIKILVANTKGLWTKDTKVYIDKIEFLKTI